MIEEFGSALGMPHISKVEKELKMLIKIKKQSPLKALGGKLHWKEDINNMRINQ